MIARLLQEKIMEILALLQEADASLPDKWWILLAIALVLIIYNWPKKNTQRQKLFLAFTAETITLNSIRMITLKVGGAPFNAHIKATDTDGNILEPVYQNVPTLVPGSISVASADENIAFVGRTEGDEAAVAVAPVAAGTTKITFTATNSKGETISGEQEVTVAPADVVIPVAAKLVLVEDAPV